MPSTYSTNLRIELVADNEQSGIWGQTTNRNFTQVFEETITATAEVDVTAGDVTLTAVNGATDQARRPFIRVIGSPVVARQVNVPDVTKLYFVQNTTGQNVTIKPTGQTGVTLLMGQFGYVRTRTGLSAQLIELLATVSGNLTVPGTLTVTGASTFSGASAHTGAITVTMPNAEAINIRSGNAANYVVYTAGRTATEAIWGISGGASNVVLGDVAGDFGLRNVSGRILFAPNGITASIFMNASGLGVGISPTAPLHALLTANTAYSSVDMVASGVVQTLRNATTTNATAAVIRLDVNGSASSAIAAVAAVHTGDGASALAFGTRFNAAGNIIERMRIDNAGNVGINTTPSGFRLNVNGTANIDGTLSGTSLAIVRSGAGQLFLNASDLAGFVTINTAGFERVRVDSSGRVGIGRTPTTHIFEVAGTTALGHTASDMLRLTHDAAFLSFYNTTASARTGFLQMNSSGVAAWANEVGGAGATSSISVNGSNRVVIDGNGRMVLPNAHNNAAGSPGAGSPCVLSGSLGSGTVVASTNITSVFVARNLFSRVGNVVTWSGIFSGNVTTGGAATNVTIALPIASNFGVPSDLSGSVVQQPASGAFTVGAPSASTGSDAMIIAMGGPVAGSITGTWIVQYEVLA